MDCVTVCPNDALYYGFTKPALFKSAKTGGRFGVPYDFSIAEDVFLGVVFVAALLIFRGLYGTVPFLLTLAIAAIIAYLTVVATRLGTRANVRLATWLLKTRLVLPSTSARTALRRRFRCWTAASWRLRTTRTMPLDRSTRPA